MAQEVQAEVDFNTDLQNGWPSGPIKFSGCIRLQDYIPPPPSVGGCSTQKTVTGVGAHLKHGGLDHMVAWYARSWEAQGYDLEEHPSFYDYACGVMASLETPSFITEDGKLRNRFPPRPLPGLGSGLMWEPEAQLLAA
jgi:hypothetical protein